MALMGPSVLNMMADVVKGIFGGNFEAVRYEHRERQGAEPTSTVDIAQVRFEGYTAQELSADPQVQRTDQRVRIAVKDLTMTPTDFDQIIRTNGQTWRVVSTTGGTGTPWWQCQVRQI